MRAVIHPCGLAVASVLVLSPCLRHAGAVDTQRTECRAFHNLAEDSGGGEVDLGFGRSIAFAQGSLLSADPLGYQSSNDGLFGRAVLFSMAQTEPIVLNGEFVPVGTPDRVDCRTDGGSSTRCSYFGYSVALGGGFAAVGEPWREGATSRDTGRVSIHLTGTSDEPLHVLGPSDPDVDSGFGRTLILRDDVLLVGIDGVTDADGRRGAVEVFDTDGFASLGMLPMPPPANLALNDVFGHSIGVDASSDLVVIGSRNDPNATEESGFGAAHLYSLVTSAKGAPALFERITSFQPPFDPSDPFIGTDEFGASVAIEAGHAAVGAPGRGSKGMVYLYTRGVGGIWSFDRTISAPNGDNLTAFDFGSSLEISDGRVYVGAPGTKFLEGSKGTGAVFSFDIDDPGACIRTYRASSAFQSPPLRERLGYDIEVDGDFLYAGAPGRCCDLARVLRFSLIPADVDFDGTVDVADLLSVITAWGTCSGCPEDINCDGLVNVSDLLEVIAEWRGVQVTPSVLHGPSSSLGG